MGGAQGREDAARPEDFALQSASSNITETGTARSPAATPNGSPAPRDAGPAIAHFKLDNGLDVLVVPDHRAPVVTHMVWYRNGSADDPQGKSGIAHFLEHLMFKGTHKHPQGEFSHLVAELGGQENAFTGHDYTAYFQRVPREHLATVMAFEADRMTNLVLSDEIVAPERDVVIEERRMRTETDPAAELNEALEAALFTHHPYGTPIIGWMHEIESLGREDALAYYARFYTPENAILIIAGDVDAAAVEPLARDIYGAIPSRGEAPKRWRPREPEPRVHRLLTLADPKVEQASLERVFLVPSYRTAAAGEAEALEVAAHLLGGGATSSLYKALVLDRKLAVGIGAYYMGTAVDQTRLMIFAVPAPGVLLEDLEKAVDEQVAEFLRAPPAPADLERAKTRLVADAVYAQDNQTALARWYGRGACDGRDARRDSYLARPDRCGERRRCDRDIRQMAAQIARGHRLPAARWHGCVRAGNGGCSMSAVATLEPTSRAARVQKVRSPGGIEGWLVEDYAVPLVAIDFAMAGGAAQDSAGKPGVASLLASLLDEGAGPLDAQAFHQAIDDLAIHMSFGADRDHLTGHLLTLVRNLEKAVDLLRLAVSESRLDFEPIDRVRAQIAAGLRRERNDPDSMAARTLRRLSFPDHPYGRPARGELASLGTITRDDLVAMRTRSLSRDRLVVAAVGAIDAQTFAKTLDAVFGPLPARGALDAIAPTTMTGVGDVHVEAIDIPQTDDSLCTTGLGPKGPRLRGGHGRQPHTRRRRVHGPPVSGSARKAGPRLFRVLAPPDVRTDGDGHGRHVHEERAREGIG